jgi:prepilin-type N-terminal cleavage/methylation domain-containing protein
MRWKNKRKGFTLIEILLVVVIIGIMLAVIVPRAWRANIDTKYGLVRQNCSELGSFTMEWAENQIESAGPTSAATINNYLSTLVTGPRAWVGATGASNWNDNTAAPGGLVAIPNRVPGAPETSVFGITPPDKQPRNPFNGASVFSTSNDGNTGVIAGAIFCGGVAEPGVPASQWNYYAFVFLGTDSLSTTDFHASQSIADLEGLRNGVFLARVRPSL